MDINVPTSTTVEIQTLPLHPEPPVRHIHLAAKSVPNILAHAHLNQSGEYEMEVTDLVKKLIDEGHNPAATHWAVHRLVSKGFVSTEPNILTYEGLLELLDESGSGKLKIEKLRTAIGEDIHHLIKTPEMILEKFNGVVSSGTTKKALKFLEDKAPEITPVPSTPYIHFKLVSTPKLWRWWRNEDEFERQENLLDNQAEDIVSKPFSTCDEETLEKSIGRALGGDDSLKTEIDPQPFEQGKIVFYPDRVELCGVDICSGTRCQNKRWVLDLLRQKRSDGDFVAYSGDELVAKIEQKGGHGTAAAWIRDLRSNMKESLLNKANLLCNGKAIIRSGGLGYHFADCITVHDGEQAEPEENTDLDDDSDVHNVRNDDACDVHNVPDRVHNEDFEDVPNDDASERRAWILQRLAEGCLLRSPLVVEHFNCSSKTAHRDLTALKDEGRIEFFGKKRTGHYRLLNPSGVDE